MRTTPGSVTEGSFSQGSATASPGTRGSGTRHSRRLLTLALLCFAVGSAGMHVQAQPAAATPLPAEAYGRLPEISDAALSPDGTKVVLAVSDATGLQAYKVHATNDGSLLRVAPVGGVGREEERTVLRSVGWASDAYLSYLMSATFRADRVLPDNVFAPGVTRIDLWRSAIGDLAGKRDYFISRKESSDWGLHLAGLIAPLEGAPDEGRLVMYDSPFRDQRMSVFRVGLDNGRARRLLQGNRNTLDFVLDAAGNAVLRVDSNRETNAWSLHVQEGETSRLLLEGTSPTGAPPGVAGLLDEGNVAVVDDPDGRGRDVLYALSLRDASTRVLVEDERHDVAEAIQDPWTHRIVGAMVVEELATQHFIDPQLAGIARLLTDAYPSSSVQLLNWSRDRTRVLAYLQRPSDAGAYYVFEPATKALRVIGRSYPGVEGDHLGDRYAIRYPARDGTQVPAYLTLPAGKEITGLPLVVLVHGGPAARDTFEFDWWSSFLASRGYAVVQPNYRGSSGYGRAWQEAGYRNWGTLMQDDVEDVVQVLTRPGKADPARVCIVGASYGGYAALAGATLRPDTYRCAASLAGVSDLPMMLGNVERVTGDDSIEADWWRMLIGDRETETERLRAISPAWQAAQARAPILLLHGTNDTVVPVRQSQRMADALRAAGKPVEFIEFKGEDHWLSDGATRVQLLRELERFLGKHLGGAAEGDALAARDARRQDVP